MRDWLGLKTTGGDYSEIGAWGSQDLVTDNDDGKKFIAIANIIEREEGLVK